MPDHHATGLFDVKMQPQTDEPPIVPVDGLTLGRMLLDKQYHGDLHATAQGQMLSAMTSAKGSAGYVAIETVTGQLNGRSGSFVLQHSGLMNRGTPQLAITVVPDSGTGDLAGLAGTLMIRIEGGKHFYDFNYTLP